MLLLNATCRRRSYAPMLSPLFHGLVCWNLDEQGSGYDAEADLRRKAS